VHIDYPTLADDVTEGSVILLDDGRLELRILEVQERDVVTEVVVGGTLHSRKGVNLPNIRTSTPALTPKDLEDLSLGLELGVDFVALSFVRDESDVANLVSRVRESGHRTGIIAKIEKPEAVERIDAIIDQSDGIMVARGDLGIEMRLSKVPGTQKRIIRKCQVAARPVITATQMLESMIENARPTRAEVSDVANAVLDGSDAVMLSGETAMGRHPVRVVEVMATIIEEAERHYREMGVIAPEDQSASDLTESVSFTAVQLATRVDAVAIACLTATGATARAIARHRPRVPLYAFTDDRAVVGRLALTWGTKGFAVPFEYDTDKGIERVHQVLLEHGLARVGDRVVITAGMPLPTRGRTNMVHVSQL
jgi:pyruvate kinase